jgi:hypothetical protein
MFKEIRWLKNDEDDCRNRVFVDTDFEEVMYDNTAFKVEDFVDFIISMYEKRNIDPVKNVMIYLKGLLQYGDYYRFVGEDYLKTNYPNYWIDYSKYIMLE